MANTATAEAAEAQRVDAALNAPPSTKTTGTDLAVSGSPNATVPAPSTYNQMLEISQLMARGGPMVGKAFRNQPGACLAVLQQAMRLGFDPYMMSQKCYLVGETIGYEAQLVAAIIYKNAPIRGRLRPTYAGEGDTRTVTITGNIDGEPEPCEYTSPPLKTLKGHSPLWVKDPDQQLYYYGVRAWARRWLPEIIMGVYTPDEIQDGMVEDRRAQGGETFSLVAEEEQAAEVEFTPIDRLLNKNKPAEPPQPTESADKKKGGTSAKKAAQKSKGEETPDHPDGNQTTAPADAAGSAETPAQPAAGEDDSEKEDFDLVATIEAKLDPSKAMSSSKVVKEHRGALARIAETGSDALKARAAKILQDWPAK